MLYICNIPETRFLISFLGGVGERERERTGTLEALTICLVFRTEGLSTASFHEYSENPEAIWEEKYG